MRQLLHCSFIFSSKHPKEDMKSQLKELVIHNIGVYDSKPEHPTKYFLAIPVSNTLVERGFSQMWKLIKIRLRSIGASSLSHCNIIIIQHLAMDRVVVILLWAKARPLMICITLVWVCLYISMWQHWLRSCWIFKMWKIQGGKSDLQSILSLTTVFNLILCTPSHKAVLHWRETEQLLSFQSARKRNA